MLHDNVLAKIDWAEIAGECIGAGQEIGYKRAMTQYHAYDARENATQWAIVLQTFNRKAPIQWKSKTAEVTKAYREMVRANNKKASKAL